MPKPLAAVKAQVEREETGSFEAEKQQQRGAVGSAG